MERTAFKYKGKTLIERVLLQTPYSNEVQFENEGCLLYFKNVDTHLSSSEDNLYIKNNEALLIRCGVYFFDLLKQVQQEKVEVIAIHLYPEVLQDIYIQDLPNIIERKNYSKKSQIIAPQSIISKFIASLELYFDNPRLVNEELLELKLKELVLLLIQTQNIDSILELITDLYSSKTVNLKRVVDLHLYSNLRIEAFAKLCNMSLSTFKRNFRKEFNDSPTNYIISRKIEKAKELLGFTQLPINEIAYKIGFNDPLYFTKLFKKKTGYSPTLHRKTHKK